MNFDTWQQLVSGANGNVEVESADARISDDLVLAINLGSSARQTSAVPIDQVQQDFFDDSVPRPHPLAGPFQRLSDGMNQLSLWPPDRR
jgi:hypothetical protein